MFAIITLLPYFRIVKQSSLKSTHFLLSDYFLPVVSYPLSGRCAKNRVQVVGYGLHMRKSVQLHVELRVLSGHNAGQEDGSAA